MSSPSVKVEDSVIAKIPKNHIKLLPEKIGIKKKPGKKVGAKHAHKATISERERKLIISAAYQKCIS